jgi:hypothetical protein
MKFFCVTNIPLFKNSVMSFKLNTALCKILVFHGGDYEECCLLGCYTVWLL